MRSFRELCHASVLLAMLTRIPDKLHFCHASMLLAGIQNEPEKSLDASQKHAGMTQFHKHSREICKLYTTIDNFN